MPDVIERPKAVRRVKAPKGGWWGTRPAPADEWAKRTIDIQANWATARNRWETPDGKYFYDQAEADRAVSFFPAYLRHHIGEFAGRPFDLLPYQEFTLTRPIFGWKRVEDGFRRFRKLFGFLPKGAGKSPWGAGTGFYLAFCDFEAGAEVYAVAADKLQARVVHDHARIMTETLIEIEPEFGSMLVVYKDYISRPDTQSIYKVISSDAATKHGFRPHGVIFDEMHAQKNRNLYEALKKSMVKRRQPLMAIITHAGHDDEGICYEEYEYAKAVLNQQIEDDSCLPVIFEMSPEADWTDPAEWRAVNPGHGITVKSDAIAQECQEAQNEPRKRNDFLMFHGNRWVNQAVAWLPVDWWDNCNAPMPTDEELALMPCAAGLDCAQKIDLVAFVVAVRQTIADSESVPVEAIASEGRGQDERAVVKSLDLNYRIVLVPFFWIPEDTMLEHEKQDHVPYSRWVEMGLVTPTPGATIDYSRIHRDITQKILPRFPRLREGQIGYDPAFATDIAQNLRKFASREEWCVEILQNYTYLSEPAYIFEALVKAGLVTHGGNRTLRNHVENVAIKRDDARRIKPVKPKKNSKHIDGVVGSLMAVRALQSVPDDAEVVYGFVA